MTEFERQMLDVWEKAKQKKEKEVRKRVLRAFTEIVLRTPVDTGRARGNWLTGKGYSAGYSENVADQSGATTIQNGANEVASWKPIFSVQNEFWITNNLPYIKFLEDGKSDQAPAGMVGPVYQKMIMELNV